MCAGLGFASVASLVAWLYGLGSFSTWFWACSAPATIALLGIGAFLIATGTYPRLRGALLAGALGGLLGTIAYDLVRAPFAALGLRIFSPIQSYGILLLDTSTSSHFTSFTGWGYHALNGICFGIAYACIARGHKWGWGVLYGVGIETIALLMPFGGRYGMRGEWGLIALALAGHVPYGAIVGRVAQSADAFSGLLGRRRAALLALPFIAVAGVLTVGTAPWSNPADERVGRALAPGASAVIRDRRFEPEWLRIPDPGCATVRNDDRRPYDAAVTRGTVTVAPGQTQRLCFTGAGAQRVKLDGRAYSGGFVLVDPEFDAKARP